METKDVQKTHQPQPDPTQPVELGRFLGLGGLGYKNFLIKRRTKFRCSTLGGVNSG